MGCGTVKTKNSKLSSSKLSSSKLSSPKSSSPKSCSSKSSSESEQKKESKNKSRTPSNDSIENEKSEIISVNTPDKSNNGHSVFDYYHPNSEHYSKIKSIPELKSNQVNDFDTTIVAINTDTITNQLEFPKFVESVDKNCLTITVQASRFEAMYPIWIEKNKEIKFAVSGKWRIDENGMDIPPEGIEKSHNKSLFNHGSLVGRVLNNDYFSISSNTEYTFKQSGPLLLKMNLNTFQKFPYGELKIKIYGAVEMPFNKIEQKLGWINSLQDINLIEMKSMLDYSFPKLEEATVVLINKLRYNSELFALQYLENISNITQSMKELYSFLKNNDISMKALNVNVKLIKDLENFYSPMLTKNKVKKKKKVEVKYNLQGTSNKVEKYLIEKYPERQIKVFIKQHEDGKPMTLSIKLILDDKIKNEIMNQSNTEIALMTLKSTKFNKSNYLTILVFSQNDLGRHNEKKGYTPKLEGFKKSF